MPATRDGPRSKNWRGNVGALIRFTDSKGETRHVQIDCGKTFRDVMLRVYRQHGVQFIDALLLTHDHADAVGGLDDLRSLQRWNPTTYEIDTPIRVLCDRRTLSRLRHMFPYLHPRPATTASMAFAEPICRSCELDLEVSHPTGGVTSVLGKPPRALPPSAAPSADVPAVKRFVAKIDWESFGGAELRRVSTVSIHGLEVVCLPVLHGADYVCFGFAFGPEDARTVYLSDYTALLPPTEALLTSWASRGAIHLLVLDALRMSGTHPVHATGDESIDLARRLRPVKTLLVGMSHSMEHEQTNLELRRLWDESRLDVQLAYDGELVPLELAHAA